MRVLQREIFMNSQNRRTAGRFMAVTAALVLAFAPALAEARAGKGSSSGSRGARTESAPARTQTAPAPAQSFQRSNPAQSTPAAGAARPGAPAAAAPAAAGGMFSSPLARGIMGGLHRRRHHGPADGLGPVQRPRQPRRHASACCIQLALIGGLVWLAVSFWRRRQQQTATAAPMGYNRASGPRAG